MGDQKTVDELTVLKDFADAAAGIVGIEGRFLIDFGWQHITDKVSDIKGERDELLRLMKQIYVEAGKRNIKWLMKLSEFGRGCE